MRIKFRKSFLIVLVSAGVILLWLHFTNKRAEQPTEAEAEQPTCPPLREYKEEADTTLQAVCTSLIAGQKVNVTQLFSWSTVPDSHYVDLADDCQCFLSEMGYFTKNDVTPEELEFPIAFSILMYENLEQVERLLRLIYRPHNVYCIHVDAKTRPEIHDGVQTIANCLENVFTATPAINVSWGYISIVEAELLCMKKLLEYNKDWKYLMNLIGRDFPLRTNLELVRIFKAYNGANDIDGSITKRIRYWWRFVWTNLKKTEVENPPIPHNFTIAKGTTHIAAVRGFVDFAVNDQRAKDLKEWFRNTYIPDEHFFNTIHLNPSIGAPGSFKGDPDAKDSFTRHKLIGYDSNNTCHGKWIREVCAFGIGDLPTVVASKKMFANKIFIDEDPLMFRCMEHWYRHRVHHPPTDFDATFYAKQLFVLNHV